MFPGTSGTDLIARKHLALFSLNLFLFAAPGQDAKKSDERCDSGDHVAFFIAFLSSGSRDELKLLWGLRKPWALVIVAIW